jgi:DNA-binding transcriptional ArsR family regulator
MAVQMSDPVVQSTPSSVTENSAFVRLLETKARVKMLDVLMRDSYVALDQSELAERAGVNQSTVSRNINVFEDLGVVEASESRPTEYRIDLDDTVVQGLRQAQTGLLKHTRRLHDGDVDRQEDRPEWQSVSDQQVTKRDQRLNYDSESPLAAEA